MNIDLMLLQEEFSVLKDGPDLKRYLRKYVHNVSRATKSVAGGPDAATTTSQGDR